MILLMIWILNRTFFRPINRIIESREKNKGGHSSEAKEILRSVEEKQSRYEAALLEARSKGYELIEGERSEAVAKKQAEISAVKEEVSANDGAGKSGNRAANRRSQSRRSPQEAEKMAEKISSNILKSKLKIRFKIQDLSRQS